jgi:hypothetical protein
LLKSLIVAFLVTSLAGPAVAAEVQGILVDWNCVKPMVEQGIEKTLKHNRSCSLMKDYRRPAYGLITTDKKYYRLEDPANSKILQVLKDSPDKNNLHVVVTGDLEGNTIKIDNISLL